MNRDAKKKLIVRKLTERDEAIYKNHKDVVKQAINNLRRETSFYNYTWEVLRLLFQGNYDYPSQNTVIALVRKVKYTFVSDGVIPTTWSSDQSNVSRQLKALMAKKIIYQDEQKNYRPYDEEYAKRLIRNQIMTEVKFNRDSVFHVSSTTLILEVSADTFMVAGTLLKEFLGKNCYKILEHNGLMIVLLEGSEKELKRYAEELDYLVEDTYNHSKK